jgi:hypothetical protein
VTKEDIEIMKRYDDYSVEELKAALQRYFLYSDLTDEDVDEMERILAAIRKKAPFPHPHTTEEMWAEFKADHAEELAALGIRKETETEEVVEEEPETTVKVIQPEAKPAENCPRRFQGFLRVGLIAAAVVVLMVVFTIAASAMGFNLWGWVPVWGDEVLSFEPETTENTYVESIPDVLKRLGITEPLYPTWLPEDMERENLLVSEKPLLLTEEFQGTDRWLILSISPTTGSDTATYQKEEKSPMEYLAGNTVHYVFDNTNNVQVVWHTENYTTVIDGNVSLDEMKRIIDSVYEEKK